MVSAAVHCEKNQFATELDTPLFFIVFVLVMFNNTTIGAVDVFVYHFHGVDHGAMSTRHGGTGALGYDSDDGGSPQGYDSDYGGSRQGNSYCDEVKVGDQG